jgi:hypothetical protein
MRRDLVQPPLPPPGRKRAPQKHRVGSASVFTESDKGQIRREGLTIRQVTGQINLFKEGVPFVDLNRPCRVGDGIHVIPEEMQEPLIALHEEAAAKGRLIKFVPASGAASRMFADWYKVLEGDPGVDKAEAARIVATLDRYAFVTDLRSALAKAGLDLDRLRSEERYADILAFILMPAGLNYGQLPKALLKFHAYPWGSRTALEEHLVEAALYVRDASRISRFHVTVSEDHRTLINERLARVQDEYERQYDTIFELMVSIQESSTKTVAVDMHNRPFRLDDGLLCFRPGGHGALLNNLNAIDGDIIFLKNIDNIVSDRFKETTVLYKKLLCGYLISLQEEMFRCLRRLDEDRLSDDEWIPLLDFCRDRLDIFLPENSASLPMGQKKQLVFDKLNRPIRVCGMVRNEGEPGGGPFWINEDDDAQSLQIIESMQVDPASEAQMAIWRMATHFNPVDLICGVRDFRGGKFNLGRYVNPQTAAITRKSEKGRDLKALEHPGLWNGSMADWNTVFVEVPLSTFNPVKTIDDLLRPAHQPA